MDKCFLIKVKNDPVFLSFTSFDNLNGTLTLTVKRRFKNYDILNDCSKLMGRLKFGLLKNTKFELFDMSDNKINTISYSRDKGQSVISYNDYVKKFIYENRIPHWNKKLKCEVLKFNRSGYKPSKKNFQMANFRNESILEFGLIDKKMYRLEYNSEYFTEIEAMSLIVTKFHYI